MADLEQAVAQIRERIRKYAGEPIGETDTKSVLIDPILRALGWDVEDLDEVKREYEGNEASNPVDYALLLQRTPRLFVEAKALGMSLGDGRWANQIMSCASVAGVAWVGLTDGNEWRIHNSHAAGPVQETLFRTVRIDDPASKPEDTLQLLSKAQMQDDLISVVWQSHFIDRQLEINRQIEAAATEIFGPDSDPALVRMISKRAPALSPREIRAALVRARVQIDFAVESFSPAWNEQMPRPAPARRPSPASSQQRGEGHRGRTAWSAVTLRDLIDGGFMNPPVEIEVKYKNQRLVGRINADATVTWDGTVYNSLSAAAGEARKSIVGAPPGYDHPSTNGWIFWRIRDTDGSFVTVDALRQRAGLVEPRQDHRDRVEQDRPEDSWTAGR